jgi:hypothetical protein
LPTGKELVGLDQQVPLALLSDNEPPSRHEGHDQRLDY